MQAAGKLISARNQQDSHAVQASHALDKRAGHYLIVIQLFREKYQETLKMIPEPSLDAHAGP
jgi:hypothetical protein